MFDGMRSVGWLAGFYFLAWVIIGALVLKNLLLVIILESYVWVAEKIKNEEAADAKRIAEDELAALEAAAEEAGEDDPLSPSSNFDDELAPPSPASPANELDNFDDEEDDATAVALVSSCFCFAPDNGVRKICIKIADSDTLERSIIACIFLNCITMSMDTPDVDPNSDTAKWLWRSGFFFTLVFTMEAVVKMIGYGVAHPVETAYLALGWNRLDFAVLLIAWIDTLFASYELGALKALRALRATRILNKIQGLRVLILALGATFYWFRLFSDCVLAVF